MIEAVITIISNLSLLGISMIIALLVIILPLS